MRKIDIMYVHTHVCTYTHAPKSTHTLSFLLLLSLIQTHSCIPNTHTLFQNRAHNHLYTHAHYRYLYMYTIHVS